MVFFITHNDMLQQETINRKQKTAKTINTGEMVKIFENGFVYTCKEVAEKLRLSESTVRDMVFSNRIPSFKCGNGIRAARRFEGTELNKWLSTSDDSKPVERPVVRYKKRLRKGGGIEDFEAFVASMDDQGG